MKLEVTKTVRLQSRKSWVTSCLNIKEFVMTNGNLDETTIFNKKRVKNFLHSNYKEYWTKKINNQPKMRTYRKFKSHLEYEEYLNIPNTNHCKAMTKLRISAHRLAIEQGRYTAPFTPKENRICQNCLTDEIEDEYHFMMHCGKFTNIRQDLFTSMETNCTF